MKFCLSVGDANGKALLSRELREERTLPDTAHRLLGRCLRFIKMEQQASAAWLLFVNSTSVRNQYRKRGRPGLIKVCKMAKKVPKFFKKSFSSPWWAHPPRTWRAGGAAGGRNALSEISQQIPVSSTSWTGLQPGSWRNLPCQLNCTVEKYLYSQPGARSHPGSYRYGRGCTEWEKNTEKNS